jgi:hypothetical protein
MPTFRTDNAQYNRIVRLRHGYAWDDLRFPFVGRNLDTSSGRIDYDYDELGVAFADNARYDAAEQVSMIAQLPHSWREGSILKPHIHWIQNTVDRPNWLLEYRVTENGTTPGAYTQAIPVGDAFDYSSGNLLQITSFPSIDMEGFTLSCIVDLKFYRDCDNDSGLFAGSDDGLGTQLVKEFDIHYQIDSFGSESEYIKGR